MIHIFFTKIDNATAYNEFENKINTRLSKDPFSLKDNCVHVYFKDNNFSLNYGVKEFENKDSVFLIHDNLLVTNDGINKIEFDDSKTEKFSKSKILKLISSHDECTIYFHNNGFARHKKILDWIKDDVDKKATTFFYKKDNSIVTSSHTAGSPFEELIKILLLNNEEEFKKRLNDLKVKTFDTVEDSKNIDDLNQKLTFLHQLLGKNFNKETLKFYEDKYNFKYNDNEHIESIKIIRDILLDKVV